MFTAENIFYNKTKQKPEETAADFKIKVCHLYGAMGLPVITVKIKGSDYK